MPIWIKTTAIFINKITLKILGLSECNNFHSKYDIQLENIVC